MNEVKSSQVRSLRRLLGTRASAGGGRDTARQFARAGDDVDLLARGVTVADAAVRDIERDGRRPPGARAMSGRSPRRLVGSTHGTRSQAHVGGDGLLGSRLWRV
jgi:hypothetical protein